jgi:hypothetical protein
MRAFTPDPSKARPVNAANLAKSLVRFGRALELLGLELSAEAVADERPATEGQRTALDRFRVRLEQGDDASCTGASELIRALVDRANSPRSMACLWQLDKLVKEFGAKADGRLTALSYKQAMWVIDALRRRRRGGLAAGGGACSTAGNQRGRRVESAGPWRISRISSSPTTPHDQAKE